MQHFTSAVCCSVRCFVRVHTFSAAVLHFEVLRHVSRTRSLSQQTLIRTGNLAASRACALSPKRICDVSLTSYVIRRHAATDTHAPEARCVNDDDVAVVTCRTEEVVLAVATICDVIECIRALQC